MNGSELRGAMWKQVKGRRVFLLIALFITLIPSMAQNLVLTGGGVTIPAFFGNPFLILTNLLTFGLCKIALGQVEGEEKRFGGLFFFLKDGLFGKALILSLVLWLVNTAFTVLPNLLQQYGVDMMAQAATLETLESGIQNIVVNDQTLYAQGNIFNSLGMLLNLACGFMGAVLLFPIQYRFALRPKEPVMDQLAEGVALGWKYFWRVLGYRFLVNLPMGILFVAYVSTTIFTTQLTLFIMVSVAVLYCYYQPYVVLAEAALAKKLFTIEETAPKSWDTGRRLKG